MPRPRKQNAPSLPHKKATPSNTPRAATPERIATIFGGAGFVGRYITQRLAQDGWRLRVAVRHPHRAGFVKTFGAVGQIDVVAADVRDANSVAAAVSGADVVINCVGILNENRRAKFDDIHGTAAGQMARLARKAEARQFIQISAIGANPKSSSAYARSKAAGEAAVKRHFTDAIILRPSIIFGAEDQFFNRFAGFAKMFKLVPVVCGASHFQPVFVDDIARVVALAARGQVKGGTYELGGPAQKTFRELMQLMLKITQRRAWITEPPLPIARAMATALDWAQIGSLGIFTNTLLTRDQIESLKTDNIVSNKTRGFKTLGIAPTPMLAVLESYLAYHRPHGQFSDLVNAEEL